MNTRPTAKPVLTYDANTQGEVIAAFPTMVLNDIYYSDNIIINQRGKYDIYIYYQAYATRGKVTFSILWGDDMGDTITNDAYTFPVLDMYAPSYQMLVHRLTDIVVKAPSKFQIKGQMTGTTGGLYEMNISRFLLIKRN